MKGVRAIASICGVAVAMLTIVLFKAFSAGG